MNFSFLPEYYEFFLTGALRTIYLSIFTVLFGVILGMIISLMRMSSKRILSYPARAYISFIRGTPILVQLFIIFYGLPQLGGFLELPDFVAGVLALSINSAAYVAEIFRAGIQAVDKGQMEAARSLGMNHRMAMSHIILPQAIKNILPALGNEFIVVIKESSIVMIIGIHELMYNANIVKGSTYQPFEPLVIAAIVYWIITFTLSKFLGVAERRMKTSD